MDFYDEAIERIQAEAKPSVDKPLRMNEDSDSIEWQEDSSAEGS
jgi:hypothetical protein